MSWVACFSWEGEDEDEEESSQATTLHLGSPAKGRYVCPDGDDFENLNCPCDQDDGEMRRLQRDADAEEARAYKTLSAEVGKGKGRSSGRAAHKKDPKAHSQDNGKESELCTCLLYTSPSPRDRTRSRMPSSA